MKFIKSCLYGHFTNLLLTGVINVEVCLSLRFGDEGERTPRSSLLLQIKEVCLINCQLLVNELFDIICKWNVKLYFTSIELETSTKVSDTISFFVCFTVEALEVVS